MHDYFQNFGTNPPDQGNAFCDGPGRRRRRYGGSTSRTHEEAPGASIGSRREEESDGGSEGGQEQVRAVQHYEDQGGENHGFAVIASGMFDYCP